MLLHKTFGPMFLYNIIPLFDVVTVHILQCFLTVRIRLIVINSILTQSSMPIALFYMAVHERSCTRLFVCKSFYFCMCLISVCLCTVPRFGMQAEST